MKKLIFALSFTLLFLNCIFAQQQWVEFTSSTPSQPDVQLIVSENLNVSFSVDVYGMYSENITEQGTTYQRINIPGSGKTVNTGEPEMPVIRQLIAIPECDDVTLTISATGQMTMNNYYIYPVPELVEVQNPDSTVFLAEQFYIDQTAYNTNQNYPPVNAEIKSFGYLRDQKYAEVYIYPVQFNPVTQQLQITTNYELTLDFINPSTAVNVNTGIFNNVATNAMLNYVSSGMTASINDRPGWTGNIEWITLTDTAQACTIVADYLIITDDIFYDPTNPDAELLKIAQHRAEYNGFDIAIVKVEDILSSLFFNPYDDYKYERAIRRFIKRVYEGANANHTYDGKVGYVLLVGDTKFGTDFGVPYSYEVFNYLPINFNCTNDYYYSCLTEENGTADYVGDLYIGRFSVQTEEKLHNIVSKTIHFESEADFGFWRDSVYFSNSNGINYFNMYNNLLEQYQAMETYYIPDPYSIKIFDEYDYSVHQWDLARQDFVKGINNGCVTMFYYGHGFKYAYAVGNSWYPYHFVDADYLMNNLVNNGKYPFVLNYTCSTGAYANLGPPEGLSEIMTTYSDTAGFIGVLAAVQPIRISGNEMTYPPNNLRNGYMPYVIWNHLSHITGEYILETRIVHSTYGIFIMNYFGDPALNIMAKGFEVTQNLDFPCNTTISTDVYLRSGVICNIPQSCDLFFEDNGRLIVDEGATLNIWGNIWGNATIHGKNDYNAIIVNGNLQANNITQNVTFTAPENMQWTGLVLNNASVDQTILNCTFERCNLSGKTHSLTVTGGDFTESVINFENTDVYIHNANFTNGVVDVSTRVKPGMVEITGCVFNNTTRSGAVSIENYTDFFMDNDTMNYKIGDGIQLYYSGGGTENTHTISNSTIQFTGIHSDYNCNKGINIYFSNVAIENNYITNNIYGIACLDNSNITVKGNDEANTPEETQRIINNTINQVYAVYNCFPYEFHWNAVYNENNNNPLCYYVSDFVTQEPELDVRFNYWGTNFDPYNDLYPTPWYFWEPVWQLHSGGQLGQSPAGQLYETAINNIDTGNYVLAEIQLKQVISDYPVTKEAKASVKELIELKQISDQDFTGLKIYYDTAINLQDTNDIGKLANWLSNFCNIRAENYQDAIIWFENVIDNPETTEDSICAIIDLGHTYLLMQADSLNRNANYIGKYPEYKPVSRVKHAIKRNELINLLFKNSETGKTNEFDTELSDSKLITLYQNYPNPFKLSSKIEFYLAEDGQVTIEIYNLTGNKIQTVTDKYYTKGRHEILLNSDRLKSGVYYCTVKLNGALVEGKKMIKIE
ncbi:MAG: T9SS type A sorting domain-containing protein [Bacteroidales bacterium]|jgi:hypothetical protein|nr:T9SS type A sorting domain-containing protein [Bacteroidales bacterium]